MLNSRRDSMSHSPDTEQPLDAPAAPAGLFDSYRCPEGVFNESGPPNDQARPHWRALLSSFERMGHDELRARWEEARRMIHDHGVTYNVYADAQGIDRPWQLDMVPLVIPPEEWRGIETALRQRTTLLNQILLDFYGPQRLLRQRVLPPSLVFSNPAYLRPCHGLTVPNDIHLFLHAVDLARAPDGRWWVLADRTQAPSGAGYALENRIVLSRILPDEFESSRVQRLASFFQVRRDMLRLLAPRRKENPNIVLLTPGPYNETYFEQAYLARYLGFTLVEGSDLTVRDRHVYIKTLEGLQPVDVILRRVDDVFCDPLELRADSYLGVPGLVEAVRAGTVTVANALGAGAVETPALMAFLPNLCRHLLGEELLMPSVATWWCGQQRELDYVVTHLDEIVVKRAFNPAHGEPVFGELLGEKRKANLLAEIKAAPHLFVGQEQVALSMAPVWSDGRMVPRPLVMRAYVAATPDGYAVMPGGLTRVSMSPEDPVVSMQSGGGSKDTWVLSEGPVQRVTLLKPPGREVRVERAAAEVPSRVADDLFWLGRYTERLEALLRLLRCALRRLSGEASGEFSPERLIIVPLLQRLQVISKAGSTPAGAAAPTAGGSAATPASPTPAAPPAASASTTGAPATGAFHYSIPDFEREMLSLVYKSNREQGVRSLVNRIRQIAATVRDRFSADTWRIFTELHGHSRVRPRRLPVADALTLSNTLITDLAAFSGLANENMTRGHGWRFLDFGRRVERAKSITRLVRAALAVDPRSPLLLESLLEIADSLMTYRRRYFTQLQLHSVLHLLILDDTNPRSLAYQLAALADHAAHLPEDRAGRAATREARQVEAMQTSLARIDLVELAASRSGDALDAIDVALGTVENNLGALSDGITQHYFSHTLTQVN
jgi:uncharacterized circularly permuted ATP-grasp superfamily protein/uncharacterized alpha-E superfamily protein